MPRRRWRRLAMDSWRYVYCIVEGRRLPAGDYAGLEGSPVMAISYRELSAVVSALDQPRVAATMRHVLQHERLVEELMGRVNLIPVRFGTVLRDAKSVKLEISRGYASYLRDLALVKGKVELGVRVLAPPETPGPEGDHPEPSPTSGPGTRYLMEQLQETVRARAMRQRLEQSAEKIDACLMRRSEARRRAQARSDGMVVNAVYLVWQHQVPAFKEEVEAQRLAFPALAFLLTGPWPAYSFVSGATERTGPHTAIG